VSPAAGMLVIATIGAMVTLGTVVYLAGRLQGAVETRLSNIESRLTEIEHALARLGFTFRGQPLMRTDSE
jgi:hypothetical protein